VGIGNHEVIPPKTEQKFTAQFSDWLTTPVLLEQRRQDGDKDQALRLAHIGRPYG